MEGPGSAQEFFGQLVGGCLMPTVWQGLEQLGGLVLLCAASRLLWHLREYEVLGGEGMDLDSLVLGGWGPGCLNSQRGWETGISRYRQLGGAGAGAEMPGFTRCRVVVAMCLGSWES